jgi:hypothetical protein
VTNDEVLKVKFDAWPLPDDYLIEVGRIATVWGALESALNMCLYKLAGFNEVDDPTPFILLAHTNVPQRLDMLGSLCEHLNSAYPSLKEYQPVLAALRSSSETPQQIHAQLYGQERIRSNRYGNRQRTRDAEVRNRNRHACRFAPGHDGDPSSHARPVQTCAQA